MSKRALKKDKFEGEKNALRYWTREVSVISTVKNTLLVGLSTVMPLRLTNILLRLTGVNVGRGVSIGMMAVFDTFYPEKIKIGDNTVIGYNTTILTHEAAQDEFRRGKVEIGKNVLIGANTTVLPGVEIGEDAKIGANSVVDKDVEEGKFVGGVPIKEIE